MGLKKLGTWLKKNIKPIAAVAAVVFPPLAPAIGSALGASAATAAVVGAAALGTGASLVSGDSLGTALTTGALSGLTAGAVQAVAPNAFTGGGLLGGGTATAGTTALAGNYAAVPAAELSASVASQGLIPSVLSSVSNFTGLSTDTLGKLGVAGVQSLLSSAGASQTAAQAQQAAQTAADAQVRAAQIAADAAKFRPVGVTTRFGQSAFTTDAQGNVTGAGYSASPEIRGYQDRLSALATQGLREAELAPLAYLPLAGASQSLFNLGQGYLAKSPEEAAQDYITKQQALLAPSQENQLALLQNQLFQQGRGGAATAQGGNLMATSPELAAYYNSLAQSNLALAAQADQEARNRITYGAGLFDTGAGLQNKYYAGQTAAYAPFATAMDTTTGLERLAQQPMTIGTEIGGKTTAANTLSGSLLSSGITQAAATMAPANAYSASGNFLAGVAQNPAVGSALNNAFGVQQQQTALTDADKARLFDKIYRI